MRTTFARRFGIAILTCCLLFMGTAFAQTAPFGYLDSAADSKGNTALPTSATLIVSGWAGDNEDFAPVAKVQVFIDGKLAANATLGLARPDVAAVFGDAYLNSGWSANLSLAGLAAGPHTVTAVATDSTNLNTTLTNEKTINIIAADLTVASVSFTGTPKAGGSIQVTDTTSNVGQFGAGYSFTRFYLNTTAVKGGTLFGSRQVPALAAGASSGPVTTTATLPASAAGPYYLVACANDTSTVADSNSGNNCTATPITMAGPDLTESVTAPATGVAGEAIQISDTTTNQGAGSASTSATRFYLNTTATKGGTILGMRWTGAIAAGAANGPVNTTVTLPSSAAGKYFLLACANDTNIVAESDTSNNCAAAAITITGADLAETLNAVPTTAIAGTSIQITDTTSNVGLGAAAWSITRFYLNTTPVRGGTLVATRSIAKLAAGEVSGPANTTFTVPSYSDGAYYLVACANDTNTVVESVNANNCAASPIGVYQKSKTVIVDPTKVANPYDAAACGAPNAACQTITDGLAVAKAGQTVLVYPGTYIEQLTIDKNVALVSAVKNAAVIQAPNGVKLTADNDGLETLVTITGGINATVKDMSIAGPIFADSCSDNIYGIFVKNASATITGNRIDAIQQSNSSLWGCQPGVAVRFGSRALRYVGHTGSISNNTITAPSKGGIVVDGDNTSVTVSGNTITGLNVVGVIGQNGIQISRGAFANVTGNTVSGFRYSDTLMNLSAAGILLYDTNGGVQVTNNTVTGNDEGIGVYHSPRALPDGSGPDYSVQFTTGVVIKQNQASNNTYIGIHIDPFSKGNTIWNNTAKGNTLGWDELDEHADFNFNNWGTDPSQYNIIDTVHAGQIFNY